MRYTQALALAAATALVPATTHAQTEATKTAVVHQQVLSTNPLGEIAQWFNVEYERKIGLATTLGVAASTYKYMDYTSASLLLRWYPQDAALDGFYLGARTGAYRFGNYRLGYSSVLPGVGLEVGHAWLFGSESERQRQYRVRVDAAVRRPRQRLRRPEVPTERPADQRRHRILSGQRRRRRERINTEKQSNRETRSPLLCFSALIRSLRQLRSLQPRQIPNAV